MPSDVPFNRERQKWDYYQRFHTHHARSAIVQFDKGELMVTKYKFDPDERCRINDFGIAFVATHDKSDVLHHLHDASGRHILKSWVDTNMLLVDYSNNQVIALNFGRIGTPDYPEVPKPIAVLHPCAYCSGAGRKWVGGGSISYRTPAKLDKAQKEHLKDVLNLVRTQQRVGAIPSEENLRYGVLSEMCGNNKNLVGRESMHYGPVAYEFAMTVPVTEMSTYEKVTLARWGYATFHDFHKATELRIG